jgi:hypothetical protein
MKRIVAVLLLAWCCCDPLTGPTPPQQSGRVSGAVRLVTGDSRTITVILATTDTARIQATDARIDRYTLPATGDSIRVWAEYAGQRKRMTWYRGGAVEDGQSFLLDFDYCQLIPMQVVGY